MAGPTLDHSWVYRVWPQCTVVPSNWVCSGPIMPALIEDRRLSPLLFHYDIRFRHLWDLVLYNPPILIDGQPCFWEGTISGILSKATVDPPNYSPIPLREPAPRWDISGPRPLMEGGGFPQLPNYWTESRSESGIWLPRV